jgi:hypothetical protein
VEKKRPWLATLVLGLGGLAKETNLLGSVSLVPARGAGWKGWGLAVGRGILTVAPLALWLMYLFPHLGPATHMGERNFAPPFAGYGHKWQETMSTLSLSNLGALANLAMLIAVTIQFLYLVLRPQWQQAWWRVGASFALLMVFLGDAVWLGDPSAAPRVLLPLQFAFNVLVPVGRRWWPVLLLGNLTLFIGPLMYDPPLGEGNTVVNGTPALFRDASGRPVTVEFSPLWYGVERNASSYWTWSPGEGTVLIGNPHAETLLVRLKFSLTAKGARQIIVRINGSEVSRNSLADQDTVSANLRHVALRPGENRLEFLTDAPAVVQASDPRPLAFCLSDLRIDLRGKQP